MFVGDTYFVIKKDVFILHAYKNLTDMMFISYLWKCYMKPRILHVQVSKKL